jgi:hypothetical protein
LFFTTCTAGPDRDLRNDQELTQGP